MAGEYRFSFGPWNIHEGADPFGPTVRRGLTFARKLKLYKKLGFDGVQFHDDDAVPDMNELSPKEITKQAKEVAQMLDGGGSDGRVRRPEAVGRPADDRRRLHVERSEGPRSTPKIAADAPSTSPRPWRRKLIVLWLAREGTYIREAKDSKVAVDRLVAAINDMLDYNPDIKIAIEPKPNEPMDQAYIPTTGHALALAYLTKNPKRVGVNIETAHVDSGRAGPVGRDGLRPRLRQALHGPPERPERPEVRRGQELRLGQPAPGLQPGPHPGQVQLRQDAANSSASTSRPCGRRSRTWPPST